MYANANVIEPTTTSCRELPWVEFQSNQQRVHVYSAREALFCEGDSAQFVYEVLDGVVCCYSLLSDGRRQVLSFSYPGDLIGLVQGDSHRYNCDTLCPTQIRCIPRNMLLRTAHERPEVGEKLLTFATTELAAMQDHFISIGRKSAQEKVASFLLTLAHRHAIEPTGSVTLRLPMTRADIADYLGITIETVSRCLSKLKIAGVIDLPQSATVVIRDVDNLRDFAERD